MHRYLIVAISLLFSGCGVEVAGTAAISGVSKAQEAQQAQKSLGQVQQQLDAASQAGQKRLTDVDKAAGQ
jgi:uncharacterized protein YpuA (DUF1002 family)